MALPENSERGIPRRVRACAAADSDELIEVCGHFQEEVAIWRKLKHPCIVECAAPATATMSSPHAWPLCDLCCTLPRASPRLLLM